MAENLITEQELRDYAPDLDLSSYSATTISGLINRASRMLADMASVDGFFKVAVTDEQAEAVVGSSGELILSFRRKPVVAGGVSALSLNGAGVDTDLVLTDNGADRYFINSAGAYLTLPHNYLIMQGTNLLGVRNAGLFYRVSYVGGYATDIADIPSELKEAATLMVRHILSRRNNPAGVKSFSQGSISVQYGEQAGEDQFTAEARQILERGGYVRRVP